MRADVLRRRARYWTEGEAYRRLSDWNESGLSLAEYARQKRVPQRRLEWWKVHPSPGPSGGRKLAWYARAVELQPREGDRMDEQMSGIRKRIAELRSEARPGDLKLYKHVGAEVVSNLSGWRARGMSYAEIARLLGISDTSIHGWLRRYEQEGLLPAVPSGKTDMVEVRGAGGSVQGRSSVAPGKPATARPRRLLPVQVGTSEGDPGGLSLVSPAGYRVEGLSLQAALVLLRGLQ